MTACGYNSQKPKPGAKAGEEKKYFGNYIFLVLSLKNMVKRFFLFEEKTKV
jgi:hypothetical protein